jgi:hypothetical protein
MAEKEIILKNKTIETLEKYISELQKTGNADPAQLEQVRQMVQIE